MANVKDETASAQEAIEGLETTAADLMRQAALDKSATAENKAETEDDKNQTAKAKSQRADALKSGFLTQEQAAKAADEAAAAKVAAEKATEEARLAKLEAANAKEEAAQAKSRTTSAVAEKAKEEAAVAKKETLEAKKEAREAKEEAAAAKTREECAIKEARDAKREAEEVKDELEKLQQKQEESGWRKLGAWCGCCWQRFVGWWQNSSIRAWFRKITLLVLVGYFVTIVKVALLVLAGYFVAILLFVNSVAPESGFEAVLIEKPMFWGSGGVDQTPVSTGSEYVAWTTESVMVDMRPQQFTVQLTDVLSADHVPLRFDCAIRLQVKDSVKLVKRFGLQWYTTLIEKEFISRVRLAVNQHSAGVINSLVVAAIQNEVSQAMQREVARVFEVAETGKQDAEKKAIVQFLGVTLSQGTAPEAKKSLCGEGKARDALCTKVLDTLLRVSPAQANTMTNNTALTLAQAIVQNSRETPPPASGHCCDCCPDKTPPAPPEKQPPKPKVETKKREDKARDALCTKGLDALLRILPAQANTMTNSTALTFAQTIVQNSRETPPPASGHGYDCCPDKTPPAPPETQPPKSQVTKPQSPQIDCPKTDCSETAEKPSQVK